MSASETLLHQAFSQIVSEYHPFAEYVGFKEYEDGFLLCYRAGNGNKFMALDSSLNVVGDETLGTTRTLGLVALAAGFLDAFFGNQQNRY